MTFKELNLTKPLLNALDDMGFVNATTIQEKAFPVVMSGRDVMGIAQTGTGKTFAYILPLLRLLKYSKQTTPRVLILVPTRELVIQVAAEVEKMTAYMNVTTVGVYGGTNINTQKKLVYSGMDVLVATPGRLFDLAVSGVLRLNTIQKLVIDEVDEMMNLGFRHQLIKIFTFLPQKRQNLMFSATLTKDVEELFETYFNGPEMIEAAPNGTPLDEIAQTAYRVPNFNTKVNLVEKILSEDETYSKVLLFVKSKKLADELFESISPKFPEQFSVIHANKSQNYRMRTVKEFNKGKCRVLIATDLIARGLDISDITHVINFDIPVRPESYIHRIGRTGRAGSNGNAVTLITAAEEGLLLSIEGLMRREIPQATLPEDLEIGRAHV